MTTRVWPATAKEFSNGYCYKTLLAATVFNILAAHHNEAATDLHSKGDRWMLQGWLLDAARFQTLDAALLLSSLPTAHNLPRTGQLPLRMAVEPTKKGIVTFPLKKVLKPPPLLHDL